MFFRRNQQRALESMQVSLEAEVKGKTESLRHKKKLESDVNTLEVSLDHANRVNADLQKTVKKLQQSIAEVQTQLNDEQRAKAELREQVFAAEHRANSSLSELDEQRMSVDHAIRARNNTDAELRDALNQVGSLNAQVSAAHAHVRKLENDVAVMQGEYEESLVEVKSANEKVSKANADCEKLADELRQANVYILFYENKIFIKIFNYYPCNIKGPCC